MTRRITRADAWENITTGVGGPGDKSSGFVFTPLLVSNDFTILEDIYEEDHLAGKIVDALPDDAFRRGWDVTTSDDDTLKELIIDECDRLMIEEKFDQAVRWERLYGGSAIFVGADDGQSVTSPLNVHGIRAVRFLSTYDRWELTPHRYYEDPLSPKYELPELYRLSPRMGSNRQVGMLIHESRMIIFRGKTTTKKQRIINQSWGSSALVRAFDAIRKYSGALASALALLADSNQGVYKIKGLVDIIRGGKGELLKERMRAVDEVRSVINAIVLDASEESYERVSTSLSEVADLVDRFKLDVAAAAEMPVTKLFGQAPAGLNATGESDIRLWYDRVSQFQRARLKPTMERVLRMCLLASEGPTKGIEPDKWSITFPSPWSPSAKEQAEIDKLNADTDAVYVDTGVLQPHQIARARFSGDETTKISLTQEELKALESAEASLGVGLSDDEADEGVGVDIDTSMNDDEATEAEPLGLIEARSLAEKMTEAHVEKCEHGKKNRCHLCGIERRRDFVHGADGEPEWVVAWRAIDDTQGS